MRTNYLICVTLMTPYVLLLFHLLYPVNFKAIASDRVIDTLIGSGIAFLASIFIIPTWEHQRIIDNMVAALKTNIAYFRDVAGAFAGRSATGQQYKLSRRHAFVALANLSDAFGRMLQEPRRQQKKMEEMHQFVVANQMLTSYIATLAYYEKPLAFKYADPSYQRVVDTIARRLDEAAVILQNGGRAVGSGGLAAASGKLLLPVRKNEPEMVKPIEDQFSFIGKVAGDILRLSPVLHEALT
jgi:uncharacterized membrane protein YccC